MPDEPQQKNQTELEWVKQIADTALRAIWNVFDALATLLAAIAGYSGR